MSRPWMALLKSIVFGFENFRCGATLITTRFVLTAAHCVVNVNVTSVRFGEHTLSTYRDCIKSRGRVICAPPVEDFEIERVFVHENFSSILGLNDIALIKLKRNAEIKLNISPSVFPRPRSYKKNPKC
ncbi:serine protease grass-like [Drosophila busckii]|uniref:serine protease grass-like n=1 Tax=Drosophila busckii TaxID=30019 RepID=UPI00083F063B|nr:serine protease grass-like [Drosophila busckii]